MHLKEAAWAAYKARFVSFERFERLNWFIFFFLNYYKDISLEQIDLQNLL